MKWNGRMVRTGTLVLVILLATFALQGIAAELTVSEAPLNAGGAVFEVNLDDEGYLWVGDLNADEVWQIARDSGAYAVYEGIPSPSDARRASDGSIWWGQLDQRRLGRLEPDSLALTWWQMPGETGIYGVNFDESGRVWATADEDSQLYRFDWANEEMCTYNLPLDGASYYVLAREDVVWFADYINERLYRLVPSSGQLTDWKLPEDSAPQGLALTPEGELWYADPNLGLVGRLRPAESALTTFKLPRGSLVQMLAPANGRIWYTEHLVASIGSFDPILAESEMSTISAKSSVLSPVCNVTSPTATGVATMRSGVLQWSDATYPTVLTGGGWQIYELPEQALPQGIAADDTNIWFVDTGRQILGRIDYAVAATACVVEDEDGDPETTGDRTPLPGWTVYLTVDGTRQEPGLTTDSAGCARWENLQPGATYGVEQVVPEGWLPLGESSHSFGVATLGSAYAHTFVNTLGDTTSELFLPLLRTAP